MRLGCDPEETEGVYVYAVAAINWTGIIGTVVVVVIFAALWKQVSDEADAKRYLASKYRQGKRRK